jgi:hypothetical protein
LFPLQSSNEAIHPIAPLSELRLDILARVIAMIIEAGDVKHVHSPICPSKVSLGIILISLREAMIIILSKSPFGKTG